MLLKILKIFLKSLTFIFFVLILLFALFYFYDLRKTRRHFAAELNEVLGLQLESRKKDFQYEEGFQDGSSQFFVLFSELEGAQIKKNLLESERSKLPKWNQLGTQDPKFLVQTLGTGPLMKECMESLDFCLIPNSNFLLEFQKALTSTTAFRACKVSNELQEIKIYIFESSSNTLYGCSGGW